MSLPLSYSTAADNKIYQISVSQRGITKTKKTKYRIRISLPVTYYKIKKNNITKQKNNNNKNRTAYCIVLAFLEHKEINKTKLCSNFQYILLFQKLLKMSIYISK